jgi:hypothetical protein
MTIKVNKRCVKVQYDNFVCPRQYTEGELVLLYDQAKEPLGEGKLEVVQGILQSQFWSNTSCKPQRSWTTEQGRKQKMVGKKDNATPTRRKKLQQNKNKKACEVSNQKIPISLYIRDVYDCKGLLL